MTVVVGRLQSMVDALERDAADGVKSFADVDASLATMLEQKAVALANIHDLQGHTIIDPASSIPHAPLMEESWPGIEHAHHAILAQARSLAFVRALLRGLRAREAELRAEAFR